MKRLSCCVALFAFALSGAWTSSHAQETQARANTYRHADAGWLEREVYRSPADSKLPVEFVDVLVGPGRSALVQQMRTGALLDVRAGAAIVTVDKKKQEHIAPGVVIRVNQGQLLSIDNRKGERAFVARLIRIASPR
jgi:hypothetical protein